MSPDEKMTESREVKNVTVAIVGTGDGNRLPHDTVAVTKGEHQPNVVVQVVRPAVAIGVRFVNTFLTVMLGILTGAMTSDIIPASDFLDLVQKSAALSVAGAGVGLIKDLITIFGRLEQKNPLLTGNV